MRRRGRARADAGFLLAETLITFALSALVLVGLVASTTVLMRATDRSVANVGAADDLGRTLAALARDVSSLKRARWNGEEPQNFVFRGGPNSLYFAEEEPVPGGGRALGVVALREIEAGGGTTMMRANAHLSALASGWSDLGFGAGRAVPTGAARLRFHYLAEAGADGRAPSPVDIWASGPTLPAFVIVEAVEPGTTRLLVSTRIAVRADAEIGCADRNPPRRDAAGEPAAASAATPQQAAPGAAPPPAPAAGFSLSDSAGVANQNEFCGRADKGLPEKGPPAGAAPLAPQGAAL